MSTTSGNTNLVNTGDNTKVIETLPTLAGGYTDSTFIVNKWGYKKNRNTDNYNSFPATQTLLENDERTNQDIANLRFGTKIDYLQESGTYATNIEFNLVANPLINYMQDLNPALCTTTPMTVVDKRDNKEYTIARLADGQCWMTSNLNLAGGTALYSDDSDVAPANTRASGTPYYTLPNSSSSGFSSDTVAYVYNTGNETTSQANCTSTQACNSYYSWLAATAGGKDASGTAVTGNGPDAAYSICPKGWRLPRSGNSSDTSATSTTGYKKGDFYKLATAYGANLESSHSQSSAVFYNNAGPGTLPNFLLAGLYVSSTFGYGGTYGYYWSSSSNSSTNAYLLLFNSSDVYSAGYYGRRGGFSVRCILNDSRTISDITTMQEINSQIVANTAEGATATLKDSRDNNTYTVAKIKGNVWLLENLRLDISDPAVQANLTSATTNATNTTLGYLKNGGGSSPYPANGVIAKTASGGSWTNDYANPYIATQYKNTPQPASGSSPAGKIGIYYNFCAASAGSYCYASGAGTGDASQDICPAGWRMPTGGASGEYQALFTAYSSNVANFQAALSTPLSGNFLSGTAHDQGTYGDFWSSTRVDGNYMYVLFVDSSRVGPRSYNNRDYGFSVRCIAK